MAKHIIFNDINTLVEMIREQNQIIQAYEGKIPQIELDIIMSNLQRLYEDFYELRKLNQQYKPESHAVKELEIEIETTEKELVVINSEPQPQPQVEPQPIPKADPQPDPQPGPEPQISPVAIEVPQPELKKQEAEQPDSQKKPIKRGSTADLFAESENVTLADTFKSEKKSFHDKISTENVDRTLADTLQKPISDLRTGIGVNDRFVFINELFGGSMGDYQIAIDEINRQASFELAEKITNELKIALKWKDSSESLAKLMGFIRRRFL